jgi:RNA recognition motif-containing protein
LSNPPSQESLTWTHIQVNFTSLNETLEVNEEYLQEVFGKFGSIGDAVVKRHSILDEPEKHLLGYAFVYFTQASSAIEAVANMNAVTLNEVNYECRFGPPKKEVQKNKKNKKKTDQTPSSMGEARMSSFPEAFGKVDYRGGSHMLDQHLASGYYASRLHDIEVARVEQEMRALSLPRSRVETVDYSAESNFAHKQSTRYTYDRPSGFSAERMIPQPSYGDYPSYRPEIDEYGRMVPPTRGDPRDSIPGATNYRRLGHPAELPAALYPRGRDQYEAEFVDRTMPRTYMDRIDPRIEAGAMRGDKYYPNPDFDPRYRQHLPSPPQPQHQRMARPSYPPEYNSSFSSSDAAWAAQPLSRSEEERILAYRQSHLPAHAAELASFEAARSLHRHPSGSLHDLHRPSSFSSPRPLVGASPRPGTVTAASHSSSFSDSSSLSSSHHKLVSDDPQEYELMYAQHSSHSRAPYHLDPALASSAQRFGQPSAPTFYRK